MLYFNILIISKFIHIYTYRYIILFSGEALSGNNTNSSNSTNGTAANVTLNMLRYLKTTPSKNTTNSTNTSSQNYSSNASNSTYNYTLNNHVSSNETLSNHGGNKAIVAIITSINEYVNWSFLCLFFSAALIF